MVLKKNIKYLLEYLVDQIIPASKNGKLPSAKSLGVSDFIMEQMSRDSTLEGIYDQGINEFFNIINEVERNDFLSLSKQEQRRLTQKLEEKQPEFFVLLVRHTYMGYYTHADVLRHFGFPARPIHPKGQKQLPDDPDVVEDLIEPVLNREPIYRKC